MRGRPRVASLPALGYSCPVTRQDDKHSLSSLQLGHQGLNRDASVCTRVVVRKSERILADGKRRALTRSMKPIIGTVLGRAARAALASQSLAEQRDAHRGRTRTRPTNTRRLTPRLAPHSPSRRAHCTQHVYERNTCMQRRPTLLRLQLPLHTRVPARRAARRLAHRVPRAASGVQPGADHAGCDQVVAASPNR